MRWAGYHAHNNDFLAFSGGLQQLRLLGILIAIKQWYIVYVKTSALLSSTPYATKLPCPEQASSDKAQATSASPQKLKLK